MTDKYCNETTLVALPSKGRDVPKVVPARDAFYIEFDAVANAAEAASRILRKDAAAMATLVAIETFYYGIYRRRTGQPHTTCADFGELLAMVGATDGGRRAWAAFAQCFALAVPLQHCVNALLMGQEQTVDRERARSVSALGLALAGVSDREFAEQVRQKAADGMLVAEAPAAQFMADAETGVVRGALEAAVAQMARQREAGA